MFRFDPFAVGDFALIDAQAEATFRVGAGPRFEDDRSALLPIIERGINVPSLHFWHFGNSITQPPRLIAISPKCKPIGPYILNQ